MWATLLGNEAIIQMVGHEAFARGMVYARNGQVHDVRIDRETMVVTGRVQGGFRDGYDTSVQLVGTESGWTGHRGRCSCPVALDCKHAAALLVVARSRLGGAGEPTRPEWEETLGRIIEAHAPGSVGRTQLGLELEVEDLPAYRGHRSRSQLRMRPVRLGRAGRWVRSGISWDDLDYAADDRPPEQRDLLLQLRAAAGAAARFSLPKSPWLSLGAVAAGFWSLLARAAEVGVPLLDTRGGPATVATEPASVVLDLTGGAAGEYRLGAAVLFAGEALRQSCFGLLGEPAHGVYLIRPRPSQLEELMPTSEPWALSGDLVLARLDAPAHRELRRLVADHSSVTVPAADRERFIAEFLPALQRRVRLVSLDGSASVPEPPTPQAGVTITFRPEHRLRLDWFVTYSTSSGERRFPADRLPADRPAERREADGHDLRSETGETALWRQLPLPYERLPQLRARAQDPHPAASALLAGADAAVFVHEVLPELEQAGVLVERVGSPVDYRPADSPPSVEISTVETDETDWFDLHIRVRVDGEVINFEELFVALSQGDEFLVTEDGVYLPLQRPSLDRLRALIVEARDLRDTDRPGVVRVSRFQAGWWEELTQLGVVVSQPGRWAKAVSALLRSEPEPAPAAPEQLRATLRPYQQHGHAWLVRLWRHGLGGILADDMGLGKTLQTLALIATASEEAPGGPPFLVVAPTSVVSNWVAEAARFAPGLPVAVVAETEARRGRGLAEHIAGAAMVVTSYALLRIDAEHYQRLDWAGLVLDEAQFVKNYRSRTYLAARRVSAPFTLAITGTPLENSLMDLWALLSITAPGLFPHPDRFAEYYRRPIERGQDPARLSQLRRRVGPLMLRRTKEMVAADLPPKQEQVLEVELQPRHQRIYQTYLQRERQKVLGLIDDLDSNRFTILGSLTLLRQLALDPALVDPVHRGTPASKIDVLLEMVTEAVGEHHRALVFSQFTGFLRTVQARLASAGVATSYLDGKSTDRGRIIADFRGGASQVFLISLRAGGTGLNLTEADYCFVLDPWWNPAAETQAVDRAHRIGQTRTVMVYRLVAKGTIEEKVMDLKARKERLFDAVVGGEALSTSTLGAEEIKDLLGL